MARLVMPLSASSTSVRRPARAAKIAALAPAGPPPTVARSYTSLMVVNAPSCGRPDQNQRDVDFERPGIVADHDDRTGWSAGAAWGGRGGSRGSTIDAAWAPAVAQRRPPTSRSDSGAASR